MNEREIFIAASQIEDAKLRATFLDAVCQGDMPLRFRIDSLLAAEAEAGSIIERPGRLLEKLAVEVADPEIPEDVSGPLPVSGLSSPGLIKPGTIIGPYQIQQLLGEGGMGVVYVAKQSLPVKRQVALKILRPGDNSRNVLARFEQERHALAMMDHPGIARILDAGTTDDGRPFFVMELVKGIPINNYCDRENLSPKERLQLFIPVCAAVQHAHQKGIIHRDLKPSNILVALYDGQPIPKVIDFGVAKAIGFRLSEESVYTEVGSIVGTIEYMAPEQAELNNLDIDTRADVYALGVILYELMTGGPPFSRRDLQGAAFDEMLRMIREVEPQKPSTKVSSSDEIASIAAHRKLEPRQLTRLMSGDLDWVVMKALAKERKRRYQSVGDLSADINRFLNTEAVEAGPPRASYRFGKFLRRNRALATGTAIALIALIAGTVVAVTFGVRANQAYQKEVAEREQAEQISGLLESLFADLDTYSFEADLKGALRKRLHVVAAQISNTASLRPLTAAHLQDVISHTFLGIGDYEAADKVLQAAFATRVRELGDMHRDTLATRHTLAFTMTKRGNFVDALPIFREVHEARCKVLTPNDPDTLRSQMCVATCLFQQNRREETKTEIQKIQKIVEQGHPLYETDQQIMNAMHSTEMVHQGRPDEALKSLQNIYQTRHDHFGADHPSTLDSLENLAMMYQMMDDWQQAMPLYEKLVTLRETRQGASHKETLSSKKLLALAYRHMDMPAKESPLWEELIAAIRLAPPTDRQLLGRHLAWLGASRFKQKNFLGAVIALEESLAIYREVSPTKPETFQVQSLLGAALVGQRKFEQAEPLLTESYEKLVEHQAKIGRQDRERILQDSFDRIVALYIAWEKPEEAEKWKATKRPTEDLSARSVHAAD